MYQEGLISKTEFLKTIEETRTGVKQGWWNAGKNKGGGGWWK